MRIAQVKSSQIIHKMIYYNQMKKLFIKNLFLTILLLLIVSIPVEAAISIVPNGGTGVGTITGILKGNGTSPFSAATAGTDYLTPSGAATLYVPYTGATGDVTLGSHGLTGNKLTAFGDGVDILTIKGLSGGANIQGINFQTSSAVDIGSIYMVQNIGDLQFKPYNVVSPSLTIQAATGNVGIANTNPSEKLDVNGNIKIADASYLTWGNNNLIKYDNASTIMHIQGNYVSIGGDIASARAQFRVESTTGGIVLNPIVEGVGQVPITLRTNNNLFTVEGPETINGNIIGLTLAGAGTQCVTVNNAGLLSGTGSACGSGGGGGVSTVASADGSVTVTGTTAIDLAVATAPAGALTGTTLKSTVVTSSLTTVGTIGTGIWQGTAIAGQYGGTGVANTGKTITLGGNFATSGAFATTLTVGAATNVTLPSTGTLATLAGSETFTNKDLTSGTNTFPTFNQNTTGSAAKLTTARTIGIATGDATSAGSTFDGTANNTNALTLATVNANTGSWGSATQVGTFTVNAKGLITAAGNTTITPAIGSITGLGTGIATWLATPSSANLATAVTDETGSGSLVFGTSPSISGATITTTSVNGVTLTTGGSAATYLNGAGSYTSPAASLTVGTSTITSGSSGNILYNNAGVLGEYTNTGSGTVNVLQTSPTLITPVIGVATGTSLANTSFITSGTNASTTDYPNAQGIFSHDDTGDTDSRNFGIVAEAIATGSGRGAVAFYGSAKTNGADQGIGIRTFAGVTASADTALAIGGSFGSTATHSGNDNYGVQGQASGSTTANRGVIGFGSTSGAGTGYGIYGQVNIGASADSATGYGIFGSSSTTHSGGANRGVFGQASNSSISNYGVYGTGTTSGASVGLGVRGDGLVGASADTVISYGVYGSSIATHSGGSNIALYGSALNSSISNLGLWVDDGVSRLDGNTSIGTGSSPGTGAFLTIGAGTTSIAPLVFTSGTNLTSAVAGTFEYDGTQFYATTDTTGGRGAIPTQQYFHLTANGSAITTIANFFGTTSNIPLISSGYYKIDMYMWFVTTGTGTDTITLTNSSAPTSQNIIWEESPATGIVTPPGTATMLEGQISNDTTATKAITTASLTAGTHYIHINIFLKNGTGTSLKIQATAGGTNLTPQIGSYWTSQRISPNNIGAFAA